MSGDDYPVSGLTAVEEAEMDGPRCQRCGHDELDHCCGALVEGFGRACDCLSFVMTREWEGVKIDPDDPGAAAKAWAVFCAKAGWRANFSDVEERAMRAVLDAIGTAEPPTESDS